MAARKKDGKKGSGGRPSTYTPDIAALICARMSDGQSIRKICASEDMPDASTVYLWLATHKEFSEQYAIAAEERAHGLAEETLEIADDASNDWMVRNGKDQEPGWTLNGEHVQRSRLRVDTRKWFVSKLAPKKYGDKQTVEHTDPAGNNPFAPLMDMIAANGRPRPGS